MAPVIVQELLYGNASSEWNTRMYMGKAIDNKGYSCF